MTALAVSPEPREKFSVGVVASTVLHGALLGSLLFGGLLFQTEIRQPGPKDGGGLRVSLGGPDGLRLPKRPVVKSDAPPSVTPGDPSKATTPKPTVAPKPAVAPKPSKAPSTPVKSAPTPPERATRPNAIPLPGKATKATNPTKVIEPEPAAPPQPAIAGTNAFAASTNGNSSPGGTSGIVGNGSSPDIQRGGGGISNGKGSTDAQLGDGSPDDALSEYSRRLKLALSTYFEPPSGTRGRKVTIHVTITKDGSASDIDFERKSRNDELDTAARRAVSRAAQDRKIPPLPSDYRKSSIRALLTFESER